MHVLIVASLFVKSDSSLQTGRLALLFFVAYKKLLKYPKTININL